MNESVIETRRLGELFTFKQGVQVPVEEQFFDYQNGYSRFIRIVDLTSSNEPTRYIRTPNKSHLISDEDLFMVRYGASGVVGIGFEGVLANNLFRLIPIKEICSKYFYYWFVKNKRKIDVLSASSTMPALSFRDLKGLKASFHSNIKNQKEIAKIISTVDQKINLLTKKKEALESYKKGLMQKIFSQELRFKREDGTDYPEWEIKKLSEVAQKSTLKNKNFTLSRVLTNSAIRGVIAQEDFFDREIVTEKNLESYYISKKGDFIYNPRISSNAPCGPVNRNELGEGLFSPLYTVFSVQPFYNDYLSYYFHTNLWHRYALAVSNFGARHDRMNISTSDFFNLPFDAPTEKSEMEQIISIVACFNQKIESLNNNLDRLLKLKKGLLQQMFV